VNVPVWCIDLAASFWLKVGPPPPFPRDLRQSISALPLSVIELPRLSVSLIRCWFERIELPIPLDEPDRPLRACLVAWFGEGFAFLDSLDEPLEKAFSLAHELAHFLRDYLSLREIAAKRLGKAVIEVLDGQRPATQDERLHSVLRNVRLGPFTHLLTRDESGRTPTPVEWEAEIAADRLAFELLAPADDVGEAADRRELVARLVREFGLPPLAAERYAATLMPEPPPIDRAISRLIT
jgi:hypothetical protein